MTTRGRHSNNLYIDITHDLDPTTRHEPVSPLRVLDVLTGVLTNQGREQSATETRRRECPQITAARSKNRWKDLFIRQLTADRMPEAPPSPTSASI